MSVEQATEGPGWYPDPQEPGQERWWDGKRWTGDQTRARRPWERRRDPPAPAGQRLAHGPASCRGGLPGLPTWGAPCSVTFTTECFAVDAVHRRLFACPIHDVSHVEVNEMTAQHARGWTASTGIIGSSRVVSATAALTVYFRDGQAAIFELPVHPVQAAAMTVQLRAFLAQR